MNDGGCAEQRDFNGKRPQPEAEMDENWIQLPSECLRRAMSTCYSIYKFKNRSTREVFYDVMKAKDIDFRVKTSTATGWTRISSKIFILPTATQPSTVTVNPAVLYPLGAEV